MGILQFLRFDKDAFGIQFSFYPLRWGWSIFYDEGVFALVITFGPFRLVILNPFWVEQAKIITPEKEGDDNVVFFMSRREQIKQGIDPDADQDDD